MYIPYLHGYIFPSMYLNLMYMYVIHVSMIYSIAGNVGGKINCSL